MIHRANPLTATYAITAVYGGQVEWWKAGWVVTCLKGLPSCLPTVFIAFLHSTD